MTWFCLAGMLLSVLVFWPGTQALTCDGTTVDSGYCIKLFSNQLSFTDSVNYCKEWGGSLVEIFESDIQQAVQTELLNNQSPDAWIGAAEDSGTNSNLWTWTDECSACNTGAGACYGSSFDIVFILDSSGSIQDNAPPGVNNWQSILDVVINFVSASKIAINGVHVGLVTFSNSAMKIFDLNTYMDASLMIKAINATPYDGGNTNTYSGLQMARTQIFGNAGDRPNVPNVAIVITDGVSTTNHALTLPEAARLQRVSLVYAVGVTNQIDITELSMLSSPPHALNITYWLLNNYGDLEMFTVIGAILNELCAGLYTVSLGGPAPGWSLTSQGCYSDSTMSPQFTYTALTQSNMLTIDLCTRACSSAGFLYAATQSGRTCFCGVQFGSSQHALVGQCNVPCSGNPNQYCGGVNQNYVLRINGLFSAWAAGQPNNNGGQQLCGAMDATNNFLFNDQDCSLPYRYTCELPLILCSMSANYFTYQTRCIYVSAQSDRLSWLQARMSCVAMGGDLLSIGSSDMLTVMSVNMASLTASDRYFWLGLARTQWLWLSGDAVAYNNFAAGEPTSPQTAQCAYISGQNFDWLTSQCSTNRSFVCMRDLSLTLSPPQMTAGEMSTNIVMSTNSLSTKLLSSLSLSPVISSQSSSLTEELLPSSSSSHMISSSPHMISSTPQHQPASASVSVYEHSTLALVTTGTVANLSLTSLQNDIILTQSSTVTTVQQNVTDLSTLRDLDNATPVAGASKTDNNSGLSAIEIIVIVVCILAFFILLLLVIIIFLLRCCCTPVMRVTALLDARPMASAPWFSDSHAFNSKQLPETGSVTCTKGSLLA